MEKTLNPTWDLDVIFPGGSTSAAFAAYLQQTSSDIDLLAVKIEELGPVASRAQWGDVFEAQQNLQARFRQAVAFTSCLTAQNVKDTKARMLQKEVQQLHARFQTTLTKLDKQILQMPEAEWQQLLTEERFVPLAFPLAERRRRAADKLPAEQEALIADLEVDGYHSWMNLYNAVIGRMTIPFTQNGETVDLSVGQAHNLMDSADFTVRSELFAGWEAAFAEQSELIATVLNHLSGFRVQVYKHRGWASVLEDPLDYNRMTAETLQTMWEVIEQNKAPFVQYLERKAQLLGLPKLSWFDLHVPVGEAAGRLSYTEGAEFIIAQFARFNPKLATFAERAFAERWIEAEDRPGKRPGGFCSSFPANHQSRIFMTFDGSPSTVSTLAHELGHAYHQHVMNDLPFLVQGYAMNVAETASTFAEMIVADAALRNAENTEERIVLLENKLQNAISFFMDIHARFLFETRFYEERKKGMVSAERLCELMTQAQKAAFHNALDQYHPHFWASKLHFYSTSVPFYNFPYTFGYLFSAGVYARALQEGPNFAEKYDALLRDTARMTTEELAMKHLGVDLTKPEFWQSAVDMAIADVREFMDLTSEKVVHLRRIHL